MLWCAAACAPLEGGEHVVYEDIVVTDGDCGIWRVCEWLDGRENGGVPRGWMVVKVVVCRGVLKATAAS